MTVEQLIEKLQNFPKDAEVVYWDELVKNSWVATSDDSVVYNEKYKMVEIG